MFLLTDVLVFFFFFSYAEVVFKKLFIEFNGTSECLKWFLKHYSVCSVTNFSFLVFFGSFFSPLLSILYFCLFVCFLFEVNIMNFKTVMQKMLTGEN